MIEIIVIAISALAAAFAVRIVIFSTMDEDPEAAALLGDTFPTTNDFLFWHLWKARSKISPRHRWKVEAYFWLNITGALFLLLGVPLGVLHM